jgi:hypothetical protein
MDKYQLQLILEDMLSAQVDILEIQTNITKKQLELFTKLRGVLSDVVDAKSEVQGGHDVKTEIIS